MNSLFEGLGRDILECNTISKLYSEYFGDLLQQRLQTVSVIITEVVDHHTYRSTGPEGV